MDLKPDDAKPIDIMSITVGELHSLAEANGMTMVELLEAPITSIRIPS